MGGTQSCECEMFITESIVVNCFDKNGEEVNILCQDNQSLPLSTRLHTANRYYWRWLRTRTDFNKYELLGWKLPRTISNIQDFLTNLEIRMKDNFDAHKYQVIFNDILRYSAIVLNGIDSDDDDAKDLFQKIKDSLGMKY